MQKRGDNIIPPLSVISGEQPTSLNMDTISAESLPDFLLNNRLVLVDFVIVCRLNMSKCKEEFN